MLKKDKPSNGNEEFMRPYRKGKESLLNKLKDYRCNYSVDYFMQDLIQYFENEVDFNLDKIKQIIGSPGKLANLIHKAKMRNTHPVIEFVQELF